MKFSKKLNLFEISSNKFVALGQVIKRMGVVLKKPTDNDNTDNNTDNIDNSISSPTIQLISTEHIDAVLEWRHRTFWDCIECGYPRTGYSWCQNCESYRFEKQFPHWTSGNIDIDDFIRKSQKLAQTDRGYMEWIPHDNFTDVEYITSGGYGDIFTAVWQEGPRWAWDENDQTRIRTGPRNVTLKILDNSQNITTDFLNELASHYQCNSESHVLFCYGISKDPMTNKYILVMDYAQSFYEYVIERSTRISWMKKLEILYDIALGLAMLHRKNIVHRNFHPGNIFIDANYQGYTCISDIGQYYPSDKDSNNKKLYGVLPYVSPEVLLGTDFTTASDIYSFGMIMWGISTARRPFADRPHDQSLASDICNSLRPKAVKGTPPSFVKLMKKCWDPNPSNRPNATELVDILEGWIKVLYNNYESSDIQEEFNAAEEYRINSTSAPNSPSMFHPQAIYTSRLLNFSNLKVW
ncbi:kinase-like domain-containing protein [Rhizophagus diaphanus]|nr:kinase-like domain-containing protein [Rhizophagus diaphanus] [Rhizophagus sp. MUCL 43196]